MKVILKSRYIRYFSIILLAISLSACNPYPFNKHEFSNIVDSWNLEEKNPNEAVEFLTKNSFKVGRKKAEKWFTDQRDYIYATQKRSVIICSLEWRVILKVEKERIVEINPLVFSQCL
jgi:hypothetical protein